MKYQPIRDVVAVERDKAATKKGVIIIPEIHRPGVWTGKVVAIGPEVTEVEIGDKVYLPEHYGVSTWIDDKQILFYREEEILMKEAKE